MSLKSLYPILKIDPLSGFIVLAICLFLLLTLIYSLGFIRGRRGLILYYSCIVLSALAAIGVVLSNNLVLLLIFWGFLGLLLYLLINSGKEASQAAKKALIIIAGSDALMLFGIGIIYYLTGTLQMDRIKVPLVNTYLLPTIAYLCVAIACFAKAGVMPFHSWIPDCAQSAPVPVVAFLPAALDKLLGIYLLARISLDLFVLNPAINILLMLMGAFTIIIAVMMALVQHNMKRLLGFHAVSQVGYMVLGIGTGNPIALAGSLFHMLNNAIYKSSLFFNAGSVEQKMKTTDLDKLGALSAVMPFTYITCLIASISISGIPPFNGFVSKWMIYQGLIDQLQVTSYGLRVTSIFCLVIAMLGSGLTLASFMKLIHATFFSQAENKQSAKQRNEVNWTMWFPSAILAFICLVFGVWAFAIPLKYFIFPALNLNSPIGFGVWPVNLAVWLIVLSLAFGFIVFKLSKLSLRKDSAFVGSGTVELEPESRVSGTDFYNTVAETGFLPVFYKKIEAGIFDIYTQAKKSFWLSKALQYLHNGILPSYLVWMLLGVLGLFVLLIR